MFCGRHAVAMGAEDRPHHPLLVLKLFSGEGNFDDWISHFETVVSTVGVKKSLRSVIVIRP